MNIAANAKRTVARTIVAGAVSLGIAAAALAGPAGPAHAATAPATAGVGVQLLDGSAPNTSWMQASIAQGSAKTWHVKMTNTGTVTETVAGAASAQLSLASGGPARQPVGTLQPWISYSAAAAALAPGQSVTVAVTVTVPAAAPLGLVAGSSANPDLAVNTFWAYASPATSGQVQMASGAGIRMYITVTR
jgi:hypothetical protein